MWCFVFVRLFVLIFLLRQWLLQHPPGVETYSAMLIGELKLGQVIFFSVYLNTTKWALQIMTEASVRNNLLQLKAQHPQITRFLCVLTCSSACHWSSSFIRQQGEGGRETEGNAIKASDFSFEKVILAGGCVWFLVFVHTKGCKWKRKEDGVWTVSVGCKAVFLLRRWLL